MDRFTRWLAKHRLFASILFSVIFCGIYTAILIFVKGPIPLIVGIDLFLLLVCFVFVYNAPVRLLNKAITQMNVACDPEALLNETDFLLTLPLSESMRLIVLLDRSASLINLGQTKEAEDILSSVNACNQAAAMPYTRFIHYNNLAEIRYLEESFEELPFLLSKMEENAQGVTSPKEKKQCEACIAALRARLAYARGEYKEALLLLREPHEKPLSCLVDDAFLNAKLLYKLGRTESAQRELEYVIQKGNKLVYVTQAQALLDEWKGRP